MVGCVLAREGRVIAEGWHEELGGAHAEVNALKRAGKQARGATAYVSLEPCDHFGRTPPCSSALVQAGIARVVYGATDPGPESGGGSQTLRAGGVDVVGPVLDGEEARRENPAFFFNQEHGATYVALKLAQTLDGRIAEAPGCRTAITGPEARQETHRLRAGFDGVMVGSGDRPDGRPSPHGAGGGPSSESSRHGSSWIPDGQDHLRRRGSSMSFPTHRW